MDTKKGYKIWSSTYDLVENKTRDTEKNGQVLLLKNSSFENILELGCGTGKNTAWLATKAKHVTAVDFCEEMMTIAKDKVKNNQVDYVIADIQKPWHFLNEKVDLVSCSLILEHINNLEFIFAQAAGGLKENGLLYIGELHPFKVYSGSKAKYEDGDGIFTTIEQYTHHFTDYLKCAEKTGFKTLKILELFHESDIIPRIAAFLFEKV